MRLRLAVVLLIVACKRGPPPPAPAEEKAAPVVEKAAPVVEKPSGPRRPTHFEDTYWGEGFDELRKVYGAAARA